MVFVDDPPPVEDDVGADAVDEAETVDATDMAVEGIELRAEAVSEEEALPVAVATAEETPDLAEDAKDDVKSES